MLAMRKIIGPILLAMGIASAGAVQGQDAGGNASEDESAAPQDAGRKLFTEWSCGTCHRLTDADGTGDVGPSLDGNAALSADKVVAAIRDGQGAMPGFGEQLSQGQIASLAAYVMAAKE